jgi:hypothetical protein
LDDVSQVVIVRWSYCPANSIATHGRYLVLIANGIFGNTALGDRLG